MALETPLSPVESLSQPEPTLAENLATLAERTDRLATELEAYAGTNTYPDWWMQDIVQRSTVINQLRDPAADPRHISEYFQTWSAEREIRTAITGRELRINPLPSLSAEIGTETVARGFAAEEHNGPLHATLFNELADTTEEPKHIAPELDILRIAYGKDSMTDLLGPGQDKYTQALRPFLRTENALRAMRSTDSGYDNNDSLQKMQHKDHKWMAKALSVGEGVSEAEAADYTFAASRQLTRDKPFVKILEKFDRFGAERLQEVAKATGIHSFENYSDKQLELMEEFAKNPQELAKKLAGRDVNVVMINRFGEHNGTLADVAETFEDGTGRTLFFEINNMGDIYRHMLKLRDADIKPSGLFLASHSAPGQFFVSDERDPSRKRYDLATVASQAMVKLVNESNTLKPGYFGYALHGMKGMARIVEDFMQPSRGIDDNDDDTGRKKILFQACHTATQDRRIDVDKEGTKFVAGMDSVIGRLAEELADHTSSNVDVFGAPGGIQLHKTDRGVEYSGPPTKDVKREKQHAVRIRLENAELVRQEIDEVILHKTAA